MIRALLLATTVACAAAGAVELTADNYDELTSGKNAFIKPVVNDAKHFSKPVDRSPFCARVLTFFFHACSVRSRFLAPW